MYNMLKFLSNC